MYINFANMISLKRRLTALCAGLFLAAGLAWAQGAMTDTQVMEYVRQGIAQGKSQKEMVAELHSHGIKVTSMPFQGGELEETYLKLHDLGFDGFSTDYPSVMFKVINDIREGKGE